MATLLDLPWFIRYQTLDYVLTATSGKDGNVECLRLSIRTIYTKHGIFANHPFPFMGTKQFAQYHALCLVNKQIGFETRMALLRTSMIVIDCGGQIDALRDAVAAANLAAIRYVGIEVNHSYWNDTKPPAEKDFDCLDIRYDALKNAFPNMISLDVIQNPGSDKGYCQASFVSLTERYEVEPDGRQHDGHEERDNTISDQVQQQQQQIHLESQQQQQQHDTRGVFETAWGNSFHLSDMVYGSYALMGTKVEEWLEKLIKEVRGDDDHTNTDNTTDTTSRPPFSINSINTITSTTSNNEENEQNKPNKPRVIEPKPKPKPRMETQKKRNKINLNISMEFQCGADPRLKTENLTGRMSTDDFILHVEFEGQTYQCPQAFLHYTCGKITASGDDNVVPPQTNSLFKLSSSSSS